MGSGLSCMERHSPACGVSVCMLGSDLIIATCALHAAEYSGTHGVLQGHAAEYPSPQLKQKCAQMMAQTGRLRRKIPQGTFTLPARHSGSPPCAWQG